MQRPQNGLSCALGRSQMHQTTQKATFVNRCSIRGQRSFIIEIPILHKSAVGFTCNGSVSHSIHKCIIKQIIIFMVQICHPVRHYLCHKNDTRCRKHCSNWGGVWRKCHMHPPTKVLHISDGVISRHQIITIDQCQWGWDCTYLVLSILTHPVCSIAPCKFLRKMSFPNLDR